MNNLFLAPLNINIIRNKFEFLNEKIKNNKNVLTTSEIKLDDKFPILEFLIDGIGTLFQIDRNVYWGGTLLHDR